MLGLRRCLSNAGRRGARAREAARARRWSRELGKYEAVVRDHVTQITEAVKKAGAVHSGVPLFFVPLSRHPTRRCGAGS